MTKPPPKVKAPRRHDGLILACTALLLAGAVAAFIKLQPRGGATAAGAADTLAPQAATHVPPKPAPLLASAADWAGREAQEEQFADEETDEQAWKRIATGLKQAGTLRDGVFTVTFPRADLSVTVHGNAVPAGAGLESRFDFYRCPCGKINVVGQFVVADYEANDVLDALRAPAEGAELDVASVGPLLLYEKPRLLLVRFQGEGDTSAALAKPLRAALDNTGKARSRERPLGLD